MGEEQESDTGGLRLRVLLWDLRTNPELLHGMMVITKSKEAGEEAGEGRRTGEEDGRLEAGLTQSHCRAL